MSKSKLTSLDEPSSSGGYIVRQVMRFAFFMRRPHLQLAPHAVSAMEQIIDQFPPPALSMFAGPTGDWFDFDSAGLKKQVAKRLVGKHQTINGTASISGDQANIPDVSVDYNGFAIDLPVHRERASHLVLTVAASVFDDSVRAASLQMARKLATDLGCSAAYIDIAIEGRQARRQALARRFRCIDISDVSSVAADLGDRMPGVYWINFLGADLVHKLGGRENIESGLSKSAHIDELPGGGLVVSLGANPDLGDVNRQADLPDRKYLAGLAHRHQAMHVPKRVTYFDAEEDASAMEAQERWHLRFVNP
jgi:hypothetical protein